MRIVINTQDITLFNEFVNTIDKDYQFINGKAESVLFEIIDKNNADAYVISSEKYAQKAIDFIKKSCPYTPIIYLKDTLKDNFIPKNADVYIDNIVNNVSSDIYFRAYRSLVITVMANIESYIKTFSTLKKITTTPKENIEFGDCIYDPIKRVLYYKNKEIKRLSVKEGGILELLASNYKKVVKKEIILEKVWRKTDYFAGRSMDVYITYLRNTLKNNKIKLTIQNITGVGLILE